MNTNCKIPAEWLDKAVENLKIRVERDLRHNDCKSDDYYVTVAMDGIWNDYVLSQGINSNMPDGWHLSLNDIVAGLRKRCINHTVQGTYIRVAMHHTYRLSFEPNSATVHVVGCGYGGDDVRACNLAVTVRTFFRILSRFDRMIDSVVPALRECIRTTCREFRAEQILMTTLEYHFGRETDDVDYRYTCISDEKGNRIVMYLFAHPESMESREYMLEFTCGYEIFLENIGRYKEQMRDLGSNPKHYCRYPEWKMGPVWLPKSIRSDSSKKWFFKTLPLSLIK